MVPKALRVVEILGTLQARKWYVDLLHQKKSRLTQLRGCPSLNEFRTKFGLKRHETMEDVNPDPDIADILRKLYTHPDMVELYPGLFLEDGKPRMDPGCGGCPPYTVGRAVFSDAITLVRSDRFYTVVCRSMLQLLNLLRIYQDYTPSTLTNWGMQEVQSDKKT
jgi:hypothetical protein